MKILNLAGVFSAGPTKIWTLVAVMSVTMLLPVLHSRNSFVGPKCSNREVMGLTRIALRARSLHGDEPMASRSGKPGPLRRPSCIVYWNKLVIDDNRSALFTLSYLNPSRLGDMASAIIISL